MWRSWKTGWLTLAAAILCAVGVAGCNSFQSSGIDPSGDRFFLPPAPPSPSTAAAAAAVPANAPVPNERYYDNPLGPLPWDDVAVQIEPRELVAPVGSEIIVIAGVLGPDGYLRTNRRLEWSITPGSVGQFVSVEPGGFTDLLLGDFTWPRIVNATTAIGDTSRSNILLNRGTPTPEDDKYVRRGQGWISLTSPLEGTSYVNVVAPEVYNWDARRKTAIIHWVDAVVQYPPPAINPAGTSHVFTTTVTRSSNQSPCENWIVSYRIVDGPPAGFVPNGAPTAEVRTNAAGQACVEIVQKQPASGVNKIAIQVIRPADVPGAGGQRLVLDSRCTTKTWSTPDLTTHVTGPATAAVGGTLTYQIDLSNPGDLPAKDVTAVVNVPNGLTYIGANPSAEVAGQQLRWRFGELGARQQRPIQVSFRAERQGTAVVCCDSIAGPLKARDCATTTIGLVATTPPIPPDTPSPAPATPPGTAASPLSVSIDPAQTAATVGDKLAFEITVINRSQTTVTNGRIRVRFPEGLTYTGEVASIRDVVEGDVPPLLPGKGKRFNLKALVAAAGRLTLNVEAIAPNSAPATAQATVTAVSAGGPSTPGASAAPLSLTAVGPTKPAKVGDTVRFTFDMKNTSATTLQKLQLTCRCDPALVVETATGGSLVWNIDTLLAGKSARYEVECKCAAASPNAFSRVTVTLPDGGQTKGDASVEILQPENPPTPPPTKPAGAALLLRAIGLSNPVHPGRSLGYEIRLTNNGTEPARNVIITATVPLGMTPDRLGTSATIDNQQIQFEPVPQVAPGETHSWRARVSADKSGKYHLQVEMTTSDPATHMAVDSDETEVTN